jgi:hypothetical protein
LFSSPLKVTGTLLTTVEVAERLGLSSAAVAQAVRSGALQPAARTSDDLLFSERVVAAFADRQAEAAAAPLPPPVTGTRMEWTEDLDRLSGWLRDLSESLPPRPGAMISTPPEPAPEPPAPAPEPPPAVAEAPAPPVLEPLAVLPVVDFTPPPLPEPEPEPPEAVPELPPEPAPVSLDLSRQAVLVVEGIERFRVLREVVSRLGGVPGILDARLESLDGGNAAYRLSFDDWRPSGEAIASALEPLGLSAILVDYAPPQ